jgi:hypothetical protein
MKKHEILKAIPKQTEEGEIMPKIFFTRSLLKKPFVLDILKRFLSDDIGEKSKGRNPLLQSVWVYDGILNRPAGTCNNVHRKWWSH